MTPGSTTATMLSVSSSLMARIPARTRAIPPWAGTEPPERPVPAPRGTTGTSWSEAKRRTADTSAGFRTWAITSGKALMLVPS